MRDQNDFSILVQISDFICPTDHVFSRPEFQCKDHELASFGRKKMVAVFDAIGLLIVGATERWLALKVADWKVVVRQCRAVAAFSTHTVIVIAENEKIRQLPIQQFHGLLRVLPFAGGIVVGNITEMQNTSDVASFSVFENPLGLRLIDFRILFAVILSVGQKLQW